MACIGRAKGPCAVCQFCDTLLAARAALTLARTIADLAGAEMIAALHLAEGPQHHSRSGAEGCRGIYFLRAAGSHTAGRM
jgi:hypothetical protein